MTRETAATIAGLAWIACAMAVCFVLSAGPDLTLELLGDLLDEITRLRRVVIPWP